MEPTLRRTGAVTTVSWIPSEAVTGLNKAVFGTGFTHYDDPPPDLIEDLDALRAADRFRFANHLSAWIEVVDGRIVDAGQGGGGVMGSTTVAVGSAAATFAAVGLPDLVRPVERTDTSVRFVQTVGGRTAVPAPRRVNRPPFVQLSAPTVWTTLALTLHADGRVEHELVGASAFPRHWVYDGDGRLTAKAGLADFKEWWRTSFGRHTPWGEEESEVLVTEVETALERGLATQVMRGGGKVRTRTLKPGATLTRQGETGSEVYLLLNGVLTVEVDGVAVAEAGPGAILGERAVVEGGARTSTLRAATRAKVAVVDGAEMDRAILAEVSAGHRREGGSYGTAP